MNDKTSRVLKSLVQLDYDAMQTYEQAIARVDFQPIREQLQRFHDDHDRHIRELSALLRANAEEPPERSRDFKGVVLEAMTLLRSVTGTEGALKAMHMNEKLTNKSYQEATEAGLPADAQSLVQKNYRDEQRHIRYIEQQLQEKPWQSGGASRGRA